MAKPVPVIAIDGPGGSGKGTLAKRLADALGWHLLDSGMLYRLLALATMNHGVSPENEDALEVMAESLDVVFRTEPGQEQVIALLEGENVTRTVRTEDVGLVASKVAAVAKVREALMSRQRAFAQSPGLVADGRDMGTIVFTGAPLKIYLTASVEERARRRYEQLNEKGQSVSLARLAEAIEARDRNDMNRAVAPLRPAADAIQIDSSSMSIDAVFDHVLELARKRQLAP